VLRVQRAAPCGASARTVDPPLQSRQKQLASMAATLRRRQRPASATPSPAAARKAMSAHRSGARGGAADGSAFRAARTSSAARWQLPAAASICITGRWGGGSEESKAFDRLLPLRPVSPVWRDLRRAASWNWTAVGDALHRDSLP